MSVFSEEILEFERKLPPAKTLLETDVEVKLLKDENIFVEKDLLFRIEEIDFHTD